MPLVVVEYVENFVILTGYRVAVSGLYLDILPVGVMLASFLEQLLAGGKARNDFLGRNSGGGRGGIEWTFLCSRGQ